jgi:hypothetical protein
MLAQTTRSRPAAFASGSRTWHELKAARTGPASSSEGQAFLDFPFDAMRFQYAGAVASGLAQRSILASGKVERALDVLERLILGPLARQR